MEPLDVGWGSDLDDYQMSGCSRDPRANSSELLEDPSSLRVFIKAQSLSEENHSFSRRGEMKNKASAAR